MLLPADGPQAQAYQMISPDYENDPFTASTTYNELAASLTVPRPYSRWVDIICDNCAIADLFTLFEGAANFHFERTGTTRKFFMTLDQATQFSTANYFHRELVSAWGEPVMDVGPIPLTGLHKVTTWLTDSLEINHILSDQLDPLTESTILLQEFVVRPLT